MTRPTTATLTGPRPLAVDLFTTVDSRPAEPPCGYYFHPGQQVSLAADGTPRARLETDTTMTVDGGGNGRDEVDNMAGTLW